MKIVRKILFSPITMLFLLVILITALGTATFIENDFGAEVARMKVYNTKWLEIVFILLSINLIGRIFQLKLYKREKISILLFHLAFVVMVLGAGITRYFGFEGNMHIREGQSSSTIVTAEKILSVHDDNNELASFSVDLDHAQHFHETVHENNSKINITLSKRYANAYRKAVPDENGKPVAGVIVSGGGFRGLEYFRSGETKTHGDLIIGFNTGEETNIQILSKNDSLFLKAELPIFVTPMGGSTDSIHTGYEVPFHSKMLYQIKNNSFVLQEYYAKARIEAVPTNVQGHRLGHQALIFELSDGSNKSEITLWDDGTANTIHSTMLGNQQIGLAYGNKQIELPFSLHLDNFSVERYPGSMSPSSFSSYVQLVEDGKEPVPFKIYMNNILKHHGYRFYQSSYDQDERGTILSVNNDRWGTFITYFGYFLMALGIAWSMINPHTFFRKTVVKGIKFLALGFLLFTGSTMVASAQMQQSADQLPPIDQKHAERFGELLIQNTKGRTEPIYTYASELMRKISRKEKVLGLTPVQLFMEMNMDPGFWINEPIIRVTNRDLQKHLGITGKYAAYTDFISSQTGYKLQQMVQSSFAKSPAEQTKFDKAIIKTDEKVNICYSIFSGRYLKIFPIPGSDSHNWYAASDATTKATNPEDSLFLANVLPAYFDEVNKARVSGDYSTANQFLEGLISYQKKNSSYDLPSPVKTKLEIAYYKYNPFQTLFMFYTTIGAVFLLVLIVFIVMGKTVPRGISIAFYLLVLIAFIIHTLGIADRWYISGHAPMSNGYESMIFISWVTLFAGFLFNKRSPFALPATAALGGLTLMVANLSFMDPEITNLVPVLQSYWLTIHVSVITASYGFLALGAIIGIINLLLIILHNDKNYKHIVSTLQSLTVLNHKTLIAGLYLLTIGTFLGAVWANESWGRYWGWDPKETWALISILVYTIVTHARLIPGMKGIFTFNVLALLGLGSILMTYFGVNYYLSGLHSYAAGDPVPIPTFVYYTVALVFLLILAASVRFTKMTQIKK